MKGSVAASSAISDKISSLTCTGAASGSGAKGFALDVTGQGNPAIEKCTSTDAAGDEGESIRALWIDTQPPVTTVSVTRAKLGQTSVTFSATDNISGVAETEHSLDNGKVWTVGSSLSLLVNGTYKILYRSVDVAGNVETPKSITVVVTITVPKPPPCTGTSSHRNSGDGCAVALALLVSPQQEQRVHKESVLMFSFLEVMGV